MVLGRGSFSQDGPGRRGLWGVLEPSVTDVGLTLPLATEPYPVTPSNQTSIFPGAMVVPPHLAASLLWARCRDSSNAGD